MTSGGWEFNNVTLPAHRVGLPGKEVFFSITILFGGIMALIEQTPQ
jgi:hypothetical protein